MKKRLLPFLFLLFAISGFSQNNPVILNGTQTLTLTSNYVKNQVYALQISLPAGYYLLLVACF